MKQQRRVGVRRFRSIVHMRRWVQKEGIEVCWLAGLGEPTMRLLYWLPQ